MCLFGYAMHLPSPTEQRRPNKQSVSALKSVLSGHQEETLRSVEQYGWLIQFLRPQDNGEVLAVVLDPDHHTLAVIEPDGTLVKNPTMRFR